jgi:hypothetical protein
MSSWTRKVRLARVGEVCWVHVELPEADPFDREDLVGHGTGTLQVRSTVSPSSMVKGTSGAHSSV